MLSEYGGARDNVKKETTVTVETAVTVYIV